MLNRLLAFISSIVPVGRASSPFKLPVHNLAASEKTPVEDLRPPNEGTREFFGLRATSDRYGYTRMEQDCTDPSGPRLFAHHLQEKYGSEVVPTTKLHHFVVYLNNRSELTRRPTFGCEAIFGSAAKREGDVVHTVVDPAVFAVCSGDDEYKRATYDTPEIPSGTSVFVIYIETESQHIRRFTRTVWPIKPPQASENIPLHQAMDAAIQFNLNQ